MKDAVVPHQIKKVFEGRVFSVLIESITTRKGGKMDVEIVRHPGSVVLIPITASGEVILVRQYRHAIGRSAWELPAGTLKPNEDPKRAAARECHEEIGLLQPPIATARTRPATRAVIVRIGTPSCETGAILHTQMLNAQC